MTDPTAARQTVVYDFSGDPPAGAIDGTEELLPDAVRDEDRRAAERHPPRRAPGRWRIGGEPPARA